MNDENLQHFNDDILKAIISLLNVPIDEVALITARTIWILAGLFEVGETIVRLGVIPRLLKMFTYLGTEELTLPRHAKVQLSIVGALSRLIGSIPEEQHEKYMPDIAAIMSVASARVQDEALDLIDTENEDGVPDEASTNQVRTSNSVEPVASIKLPRRFHRYAILIHLHPSRYARRSTPPTRCA